MTTWEKFRRAMIFAWRFRGQRTTCGHIPCAKLDRFLYRGMYGSPPFEELSNPVPMDACMPQEMQ